MHGVSIERVTRGRKETRYNGDDGDKHRAALRLSCITCEEMNRSLMLEFLEHEEFTMGKLRESPESMRGDAGMSAAEYSNYRSAHRMVSTR